jgi:hypothetical protein
MRLISFDVGIKNLAYCVLSTDMCLEQQPQNDIPNNNWSIVEWNCANLLAIDSPVTTPRVCCHLIKDRNKRNNNATPPHPCNKTAKWICPIPERGHNASASVGIGRFSGETKYEFRSENGIRVGDDEQPYCELHAKMNTEWIIPKAKHKSSYINKLKLAELRTEWQTICANAEIDKSLKKSDLVERIEAYYKSKCYQSVADTIPKTKNAGETDLVTIGRAIRRQLDEDPAVAGVTHVIIENQISTLASRMKTIQGMIAQYFIMRFDNTVTIEFVSSHNKLKGFSGTTATDNTEKKKKKETTSEKSTYKANKTDGVAVCRRFFKANVEMNKWSDVFERSKKRDDLADCFLQGVWYLKHNKIIYYAEDLKINSVFVS